RVDMGQVNLAVLYFPDSLPEQSGVSRVVFNEKDVYFFKLHAAPRLYLTDSLDSLPFYSY
ncbi:MAG: hypothetical protein H7039_06690, partial [Bryobacteraceae bacterium]|nr:hypothetical protein [Bryobacteraceae bacterium]